MFLITFYGFLTLTLIFYEKVLTLLKLDGEGPGCLHARSLPRGEGTRVSILSWGRTRISHDAENRFPPGPLRSVPFQRPAICDAGHRMGARAWPDQRRVGQDCAQGPVAEGMF